MFDSIIDVSITKDLTGDLKKSLEELKNKIVCIGVHQEDDATRDSNHNEQITNAQLLYIHTHGIRDTEMIKAMQHDIDNGKPYSRAYELYVHENGSPLWQSPPRPVLAPAMENSKELIAEQMKEAFQAVLDGSNSTNELGKIGMLGQNIARDWFTNPENKWAPNSPLTVKKKGSNRPLVDSGELRKAITWILRDKENG
jgi:hypothetical protein